MLATQQDERLPEVIQRFRADSGAYAWSILRIQTKSGLTTRFDYNRAQRLVETKVDAQLAATGRVRALILKARQEGISTWVSARVYRGCTLWFGRNGLVVADSSDHSESLFRIYERYYDNAPPYFRPTKRTSRRGQEMLFNKPGGSGLDSQIMVETAGGKNPGRSKTRQYLHLSELAFWEHQAETLLGVLQTVPSDGGEVYIESTANGVGDEFHSMWVAAEAGESEWLPIFLPWWIHEEYTRSVNEDERAAILGSLDAWERKAHTIGFEWEGSTWPLSIEQLAWRRSKITDDLGGDAGGFQQEYPSTAREAFRVSGAAFFDGDALIDYEAKARPPKTRGTFISAGGGWQLQPDLVRGYVRIWELPDPNGHYVLGADTAEGRLAAAVDRSLTDADAERGGRDFDSADVLKVSELITDAKHPGKYLRVPCLRQVAHIHGHMSPEVFAEQIFAAAAYWSCPGPENMRTSRRLNLTGVERNHSSGQTVLKELRRLGHPEIFIHRRENVRTGKVTPYVGWVTDGESRMPMLDTLAERVRNGKIAIRSADSIRELFTFVRGEDGRPEAQEGTHDDRVVSLAIAVQMALRHRDGAQGELPEVEVADTPTGL